MFSASFIFAKKFTVFAVLFINKKKLNFTLIFIVKSYTQLAFIPVRKPLMGFRLWKVASCLVRSSDVTTHDAVEFR